MTASTARQTHGPTATGPALDWLADDVSVLRREYELQRAKPLPDDAGWILIETAQRPVKALSHIAAGSGKDAIVYFHGGGFIVGSPLTHADITNALRRETGLPVYSVDYRLAPEFVAPAPAEDGLAVVEHLLKTGVERIVLCGDSAGGAIALALEASLPLNLQNAVVGVCSIYGAHGGPVGDSLATRGSREDGTDSDCTRRYFTLANGGPENAYSVTAISRPSPVPVYLLAAEEDPFFDDSIAMAKALQVVGRSVMVDIVSGATHGFLHNADTFEEALKALRRIAGWCRMLVSRDEIHSKP